MEKQVLISVPMPEFQAIIVDCVNSCLEQKFKTLSKEIVNSNEELYTIQETAAFLHLSVPTIYSKVSRNEIPYMKRGKRLYFSSIQLMKYIEGGTNNK